MIKKRKIVQLILISIGIALVVFTYFLYPTTSKNKLLKVETIKEKINLQDEIKKLKKKEQVLIDKIQETKERISSGNVLEKDTLKNLQTNLEKTSLLLTEKRSTLEKKEKMDKTDESISNTFTKVKYGGLYDTDKPFIVEAEKAHILEEKDPDLVVMEEMRVVLKMNNETAWIITSDEGSYNKVTYDCFFEKNVRATDGETIILADYLNLLASEDTAVAYNNVYLTNEKGSLKADKVNYDFETEIYTVKMWSSNEKVKIKLIQ